MPAPGNASDQFLPKCWIPEDVNWKRIKRETYKPWYKEFQGFRFVPLHVSAIPSVDTEVPFSLQPSDSRTIVTEKGCRLNFRV